MNARARTLIHSAVLITGGARTPGSWVLFEDGRIADVGRGVPRGIASGPGGAQGLEVVDARGAFLVPGFIDLHVHGGAGASFDEGEASIRRVRMLHRSHGTTRSMLSLVTAAHDRMVERISNAARAAEEDPLVLGLHLEGPFLAARHRGAHPEEHLRAPEPDALASLVDAGRGHVRMVTLAPELPGAAEALAYLVDREVIVAIGHTDADYDQARAAFAGGARVLTHAFNGMWDLGHRAPGPVAAATGDPGVILELICDGVHVHPEVVRLAFAGAPGRIALITDAMAAAGHGDGDYLLGELPVRVRDGIARLANGDSIAGSTLTQDEALRIAVNRARIPLERAVAALTETPARALGLDGSLGSLAPGYAADAVLLDGRLNVLRVWADGVALS